VGEGFSNRSASGKAFPEGGISTSLPDAVLCFWARAPLRLYTVGSRILRTAT